VPGDLEELARRGLIDLYYGDESRVCQEGYVPYGWQFAGEDVFLPVSHGPGLNCFALLKRDNTCWFETTKESVNSSFIVEQLERFSFSIARTTVIVLDNARLHKSRQVQERRGYWQERGLFLFYLPPYSPHLNLAERLWRKLKYEWLQPTDYVTPDDLFYQVRQALSAVGSSLKIEFSQFNLNSR
jgi:transposase